MLTLLSDLLARTGDAAPAAAAAEALARCGVGPARLRASLQAVAADLARPGPVRDVARRLLASLAEQG